MAERVEIVEVGPRDGLQNEPQPIAVDDKIHLVNRLSTCGFARIEAASFVSPKWVPQMASSDQVLAGITRVPGVRYAALTPNMRGFEDARAAQADEVAVFASASEGFARANLNTSIDASLDRFRPVAEAAQAAGIPCRGYVSCVAECPFDGPVAPAQVAYVTRALFDMGCFEVSLGDTIGRATPDQIGAMLRGVLEQAAPDALAGHFHDTAGRACDNITVALEHGLRVFDAAVGGLGGCPYAPGAAGNVATEAVVRHLDGLGYVTGIDQARLSQAAEFALSLRSRDV